LEIRTTPKTAADQPVTLRWLAMIQRWPAAKTRSARRGIAT
jgi:hypothetical protein